jgi:UDP-glucose 4-epimerase
MPLGNDVSMKILVTGAGGLLGGRIIESLLQNGHEIVALSRSYPGSETWGKAVQVLNLDLNYQTDLHRYMEGVTLVIHSAGMNAKDSMSDPASALYFNGVITAKLLSAAVECCVKQFIYISTAHVYSGNLQGVINEKSPVTNLHPYATSHKAGEDVVLFANEQKKIQGTVLRLSNAFGYPVNDLANCWMLLVNDLCRQTIINGSIQLNSSGNQFRNFISITEVCRVIKYLVEGPERASIYPLINVASKNVISILEMAKLVQERAQILLGHKVPLLYPENNTNKFNEPFKLQTFVLDQLGYSVSNEFADEIDLLLKYCEVIFRKNNNHND